MLHADIAIILVNDGSTSGVTDNDISMLQNTIPGFQYVSYKENKGKGYALRKGVAVASTDIILYTDIDFPYTIESIASVYHSLADDRTDIAAGIKNKNYYAKVPVVRRYISKILRSMTGVFFNVPVNDTQCGLKGFNHKVKDLFLQTQVDRYLFDLEFIRMVYKRGYRILPIEVQLHEHVVFRQMNYKLLLPEVVNFLSIIFRR